jgi:hypothetical protein
VQLARREVMEKNWQSYEAWVAHFDLLGYKDKLATLPAEYLQLEVDEVVRDFRNKAWEFKEEIECLHYVDTFIFYSRSNEDRNYPGIIQTSKHFMERCLSKGVALRGAISFGQISVGHDKRGLIGNAFLDSHLYGEDQNWLGLILTPSASRKVKGMGLNPAHHGFVNRDIPLRRYSIFDDEVFAYTFCRGVANFQNPLLSKLSEMLHLSPKSEKIKYENTIKFIRKYDRVSSNLDKSREPHF